MTVFVRNIEAHLQVKYGGRKLRKTATAPKPLNYVSAFDVTPGLNGTKGLYYQLQSGLLYWVVELDRVNIITEEHD